MVDSQPQDMQLAARLVVDGILPEATVRAVIKKAEELKERGRPLGLGEICVRKQWISETERRYLGNVDQLDSDLLPGLELGEMLGRGGMSRVYAATDQETGANVAVKILHPQLRRKPTARVTFEAEARLLCSLEHENIVEGFYHYEHDGVVYLVMERVHGTSIQEHLDQAGRFSEDAALYITLQTARALCHLHERGLVHRDVKPANILLDARNTVKLCDLGLAVAAGEGGGEFTAGTVQYVAPEQALGEEGLDTRSDIYALGVTLYQLSVGRLPFEGETNEETMRRRLLEELRSPELKAMDISPHLHYFIQKMMALEKEVRYQDPRDLIQDIEEQIQGKKSLHVQPGKVSGSVDLDKPFQEGSRVTLRRKTQRRRR